MRAFHGFSLALVACLLLPPHHLAAAEPVNPNTGAPARQLLNYLASVYRQKTLTGFATSALDEAGYFGVNYPVTGKREAIQALDMQWTDLSPAGMQQIADAYYRTGTILSFQWHWFFNGESAWKSERTNQVDVGRVVTVGTAENAQALLELGRVADALKYLDDRGVPVLWRPLHESSGGWFWWTDSTHPENTAALYRMIYNFFTNDRQLKNLLWVWNTGGNFDARFYPGDQYADVIGDDIYNADYRNGRNVYWNSWNALQAIAPTKMIALCECGELPNPDLMQAGATPPWLYALMWFGAGLSGNPQDWTVYAVRHDWMITRDGLPALTAHGNVSPQTGILSPLDNGEGRFTGSWPLIRAFAVDLDGSISRVEFFANGSKIGTLTSAPYDFLFTNAVPGTYNIQVVAYDNAGASTKSQTVRLSYGVADLALGRPVVTSSTNSGSSAVVDGNYWTSWVTDNAGAAPADQWLYVDLGTTNTISEVDLSWHWKVFAQAYSLDVALTAPATPGSWTTVYQTNSAPLDEYPNKAFHRVSFAPIPARYVRVHATQKVQGQTWGGYDLAGFEVPVPSAVFGSNLPPVITMPASATPASALSHSSKLHVGASDPNHDYLSYDWSVIGGDPAGVSFTPNHSLFAQDTTVTLARAGTYVLRATVSDGRGGATNSDVTVTQVAFNGAILTDDRSSQSGNGLGTTDAVSRWNTFAMRFVLEQPLAVQSATLKIFRATGDSAPIVASVSEGASDDWTEANGPVPGASALIATQSVSGGGVWMTFDVTDFIRSRAGSSGVATLVLSTDQNSWNTTVHTRNNTSNPPQLVIAKAPLRLSFSSAGNRCRVSWPVWYAGYRLFSSQDLSGAAWQLVASGVQGDTTNYIYVFDPTNQSRFFQLRPGF